MSQPTSPHAELDVQWTSWAEGQLADCERREAEPVESSCSAVEAVSAVSSWESWAERQLTAGDSQKLETPSRSDSNQE
jgi:hypothetical protein